MKRGRPSVTSKVDKDLRRKTHEQPWEKRLADSNEVGALGPYITSFVRSFRAETDNASSAYYYVRELRKLAEYLPDKAPRDLTKVDVQNFYLQRGEDLGPRSRARIISVLRRFFQWCLEMDLMDTNPAMILRRPKIPRPEPRFLPPDAVRRLLYHARPEMQVFVALAAYAGLRRGSIHALMWDDVNLREMTLTIRRAKGDKHQVLPMAPALREILIVWKDLSRENDCGYVLAHKWGGAWNPLYYNTSHKWFNTLTEEAGLPGVTPHDLRAHFATTLHKNGTDIAVISRLLGHADISTTMNHYAFTEDAQKEAAILSLTY